MRILLVEDDPDLAEAVRHRLSLEGFVVDLCTSLGDAIEAVISAEFRAVLLDRRLPDGDGLSLLPVLRTRSNAAPVLVLTALGDIPDRVAGLDAGAEDYLIKPFAVAELLARLRVLLRRAGVNEAMPTMKLGHLDYDAGTRSLLIRGKPFVLPRRELAILDVLIRRAGRVVLRDHLEGQVYGFDEEITSNALEAHVSRLRKRLSDADAGVALQSVRGLGYLLRAQ